MPPSDLPEYSAADQLMASVARSLDEAELPYVVIGGQAVIEHGYSRSTLDVDFTISVGPGRLDEVVQHLVILGIQPRFEQSGQSIRQSQVFFGYHTGFDLCVDFSFVDSDYLRLAIDRATLHNIEGQSVRFLSLEDC